MAAIIDATVGGDLSNSYVTVDEAVRYFTGRSDAIYFLEASEEEQTCRLIQATSIIETLLYPFGERTRSTQNLQFPRRNLIDKHGRKYSSDVIPYGIKCGQMEEALYLITTGTKIPDIVMQGFSSVSLDTMSLKVDKSFIPRKLDNDAIDYLSQFGKLDSGSNGSVNINDVIRY